MKPLFVRTGIAICTLLLWTGIAMADTMADYYNYIGTVGNKDDKANDDQHAWDDIEDTLSDYLGYTVQIDFYAKVDSPDETNDGLTINYDSGSTSGTWSTDDAISLISVKAGWGYALYWIDSTLLGDSALLGGDWDTSGVWDKELSHISTWTVSGGGDPGGEVPEPGTMALLGIGLISLAGITRRRYPK